MARQPGHRDTPNTSPSAGQILWHQDLLKELVIAAFVPSFEQHIHKGLTFPRMNSSVLREHQERKAKATVIMVSICFYFLFKVTSLPLPSLQLEE